MRTALRIVVVALSCSASSPRSSLYLLQPRMLPHAAQAAGAPPNRDHADHQQAANTWRAPAIASPATPRRAGTSSPAAARWPTPFGNLYVPNITPDDETGIGQWTADEFYRMMHTGISRDGTLMYPAMPFASYTKVTREDSDAIYAYLMSVPPVKQRNRPHELRFPFNKRELLVGWRALYFKEGEYVPDPKQSAQWNRGAYLVEGLGHCSMCHTAINRLGGSSEAQAFEGGMIPNQNWYAPSLTSNREAGLGDWSIKDIADLLQVGVSNRGTVYGPMAEVVYNSLQYMTDEDVEAMAVYLKSLPQRDAEPPPTSQARLVDPGVMELGRRHLREAVRDVPRRRRQGLPAALSAARGQPVDHDGVAGEPDPHGAERRLSARHEEESAALRHAAVLAHPERRRGRGRRDLHPRRVGQQRHAGGAGAGRTSCASFFPSEEASMTDPDPGDARTEDAEVDEIVRRGPSGAFAVAGIATAIVVAICFAFYFFVFLPRGACSERDDAVRPPHGHASEAVAVAAERRWAIVVGVIIALLVAMMIVTGLHWASMPPSRVETDRPEDAAHRRRVRREQSRHGARRRTAR